MTRRDNLELSHGATAKVRENAVKQDRGRVTNAIRHYPERPGFLRRSEFIGRTAGGISIVMTAPVVDVKIHWLKMMSVPEGRAVVGRHDGINGRDRLLRTISTAITVAVATFSPA